MVSRTVGLTLLLVVLAGCASTALKLKASLVAGTRTSVSYLLDAQALEIGLYNSGAVAGFSLEDHKDIQEKFKTAFVELDLAAAALAKWDPTDGVRPAEVAKAILSLEAVQKAIARIVAKHPALQRIADAIAKLKGGR